jgi:hypothetical protein
LINDITFCGTTTRIASWRYIMKGGAGIQRQLDHGMPGQAAVLHPLWPNATITFIN